MDIKVLIVEKREDIKEEVAEVIEVDMEVGAMENIEKVILNVIIVENMDIEAMTVINQMEKIVIFAA